jgi:hypothetical protein
MSDAPEDVKESAAFALGVASAMGLEPVAAVEWAIMKERERIIREVTRLANAVRGAQGALEDHAVTGPPESYPQDARNAMFDLLYSPVKLSEDEMLADSIEVRVKGRGK